MEYKYMLHIPKIFVILFTLLFFPFNPILFEINPQAPQIWFTYLPWDYLFWALSLCTPCHLSTFSNSSYPSCSQNVFCFFPKVDMERVQGCKCSKGWGCYNCNIMLTLDLQSQLQTPSPQLWTLCLNSGPIASTLDPFTSTPSCCYCHTPHTLYWNPIHGMSHPWPHPCSLHMESPFKFIPQPLLCFHPCPTALTSLHPPHSINMCCFLFVSSSSTKLASSNLVLLALLTPG